MPTPTPPAGPGPRRLDARRLAFAALVAATAAVLALAMARLLGGDGSLDAVDTALVALFAATLPWTAIGLWNALIGLAVLLLARDPAAHVTPALARTDLAAPLRSRVAVLVPVRDEDPGRVARHLGATLASLEATGEAAAFEAFLLSDTADPATAAAERAAVAALRDRLAAPKHLRYRRRSSNAGHKAGNLWDFLERHGRGFDLMLVLDADSLMSGPAILRLARVMEQNPEIGILQQLVTGLPSASPFPRLFQIGMRHGMRAYTLGSAWWQADCGPYWGHNAMLRVAPFMEHCRLPELPGGPPLGGRILSHDQVEAVLMRRAGREVRVLALEDGSHELNPPTVLEFVRRDLRWCQGNLQYLRLLPRLDAHAMGRVQLVLAILMYASAPAWLAFAALAFGRSLLAEPGPATAGPWLMLATLLVLGAAPKLAGTLQLLLSAREAAAYGGRRRVLATALLEQAFSLVLTPLVLTAQGLFVPALLSGRAVGWGAQRRSPRAVRWAEALRGLRAQVALGLLLLGLAPLVAPPAAPWALLLGGLLLAGVPFAVWTSRPGLGQRLARWRLAATPEELAPPPEVAAAAGHAAPAGGPAGRRARPPTAAAPADRQGGLPVPAREDAVDRS